jgi:hypothetical protein
MCCQLKSFVGRELAFDHTVRQTPTWTVLRVSATVVVYGNGGISSWVVPIQACIAARLEGTMLRYAYTSA